jgi:hypothetical protein
MPAARNAAIVAPVTIRAVCMSALETALNRLKSLTLRRNVGYCRPGDRPRNRPEKMQCNA